MHSVCRYAYIYFALKSLPTNLQSSSHICKHITKFAINLLASKRFANVLRACIYQVCNCWFAIKFATGLHANKSKGLREFASWQSHTNRMFDTNFASRFAYVNVYSKFNLHFAKVCIKAMLKFASLHLSAIYTYIKKFVIYGILLMIQCDKFLS